MRRRGAIKIALTKESMQLMKEYWKLINTNAFNALQDFLTQHADVFKNLNLSYVAANDGTALHIAAANNYLQIARIVLERGIAVDICDKLKSTALHLACKRNHVPMIKLLLAFDADTTARDHTDKLAFDYLPWVSLKQTILDPIAVQVTSVCQHEMQMRQAVDEATLELAMYDEILNRTVKKQLDREQRLTKEGYMKLLNRYHSSQVQFQQAVDRLTHREGDIMKLQSELQDSRVKLDRIRMKHVESRQTLEKHVEIATDAKAVEEKAREAFAMREYNLENMLGVIDLIQMYKNDTDIQLWGTMICAALTADCQNDKYHKLIQTQQAIPLILNALKRFPFHVRIQEHGIRVLTNVAMKIPDTLAEMIQNDLLSRIQSAKQAFPTDQAIMCVYLHALQFFLFQPHPDCQKLGLDPQTKANMIDLVQHFVDGPALNVVAVHDLIRTLSQILKITTGYSIVSKTLVVNTLRLLQAFSQDQILLSGCLELLYLESRVDIDLVGTYLRENNGFRTILDTCRSFPMLDVHLCKLFYACSEQDEIFRVQIQLSGVEELVIDQLPDAVDQLPGMQLLYILSVCNYTDQNQIETTNRDVVLAIVRALFDSPTSSELEEWSIKALATCLSNPGNHKHIENLDKVVERIYRILSSHPLNQKASLEALRILLMLRSRVNMKTYPIEQTIRTLLEQSNLKPSLQALSSAVLKSI